MTPPTVQGIPSTAAAGDTWRWAVGAWAGRFPVADGWALALVLRGRSAPTAIPIDRTAGDVAVVPASVTAALLTGDYTAAVVASLGDERYTATVGVVAVTANVGVAGALVSHAAKCLALIEAALEGRVVSDAESYAILGRSITKTPIAQLYGMRNRYRLEVQAARNGGQLPPYRAVFHRA